MTEICVQEINIYPIKGCKGQALNRVEITSMGLVGDREFTIALDGKWSNQKNLPGLREVSASWLTDELLLLSYPGCEDFELSTTAQNNQSLARKSIAIYGKEVPLLDMGDGVANWLSNALGQRLRLTKMRQAIDWFLPIDDFKLVQGNKQSKFVDTSPVLITNQLSLDDLNQRLAKPILMNRFRANIVISGLAPYLEDEIQQFFFPNTKLQYVAPCERCIITTTDQESGIRAKEPLLTLSKYRKRANGYAGGIVFGSYVTTEVSGSLVVGDQLLME